MLIYGKSEQKFSITSNFPIIVFCDTFYFINPLFFFIRNGFLQAYFLERASNLFKGVSIIEKQYIIVRIASSSHSQVLKNLLNGDELYKINFIGIWINI